MQVADVGKIMTYGCRCGERLERWDQYVSGVPIRRPYAAFLARSDGTNGPTPGITGAAAAADIGNMRGQWPERWRVDIKTHFHC